MRSLILSIYLIGVLSCIYSIETCFRFISFDCRISLLSLLNTVPHFNPPSRQPQDPLIYQRGSHLVALLKPPVVSPAPDLPVDPP